ncbi:MAG: S8 family serine peptidase [Bacillota bacterium]
MNARRPRSRRAAWLALALAFVLSLALGPAAALAGEPAPPGASPLGGRRMMDLDGNRIFDDLDKLIGTAAEDETIPVIAVFSRPVISRELERPLGAFSVNRTYANFPYLALNLKPAQVRALAALPVVVQVEYDHPVHVCMDTASTWFGVAKARADFGLTGDRDGAERTYTKDDIVIAVIDTGIDPGHVDLDGGKIIAWKDYINNRATPYDDHGHGTYCAGIAAGEGDGNAAYRGVATGAALIGLKVLNSSGSGSMSTITAAVDWCITNKSTYGIEIISMSLGSSGSSDGTDSLSQAVNRAAAEGIVPVVAAGNSGPAKYTVGSPAAAEHAITVGAMADCGEKGFSLASFSSRGPTADNRIKPDIAAPGVSIMAPKANTPNSYVAYSGTSMATPFVAGTVALMLDADPSLTPAQVKSLLGQTSQDWCVSGKDIDYGAGRLDGYEAVRAAGGLSGTGPAVPVHRVAESSLGGTGDTHWYDLAVTTTDYPIALTLIMLNWSSSSNPDFDLYLYSPSGSELAKSIGTSRQETIGVVPSVTGTYRVKVHSYAGSGPYTLDMSAGLGEPPPPPDNPPAVSVVSPAEGETVSGTYTVKAQASDDNNLVKVEVSIDGGAWVDITANFDGSHYTYTWDTTASADGTHTVTARATDDAGQTATDSRSCTVANEAPATAHELNLPGRVTSSQRDAHLYFTVHTAGYVYLTLSWNTSADLDFYVYAPDGTYIGRAYTLSNPEKLRVYTDQYGTGTYTVRVNLYSGADSDFNLEVEGYEKKAWTGTVSSSARDQWHTVTCDYTGYSLFRLSWPGSADLDFYVYDPAGTYRGRAYTLNNPETLWMTIDMTGDWRVRVNLYSGGTTSYTLEVYVPEDNLSQ